MQIPAWTHSTGAAISGTQRERPVCVWGSRQRRWEWLSGPDYYIVPGRGLPMHTHRSQTTEDKASDDPGLFVLALARRPSPVSKRRGLRSWYKFLCMHKPVLSTALATGWSGPSPLRCACVLRAVRGLSDTRMQQSSSSSFDVIMHLAGVERGADARRSPLTLRTCPPSTPRGRHWMGLSSPTCGGRP
ncbi:hypothetical protein OIDMADRAFT_50597 [Oidiodendron maius Zn]|uniref:Uncharacterized protein n=1 Tax=Oidiodendron maius (strain Zn) TaxID=913774 RepID=A0A0C3H933_OIDMZ|nr:hypothetical protein OIDMADRAFT_50597 [Oidiodendron maius Zn]